METLIMIIGLITSMSSIIFSFLAFKRTEKETHLKRGKHEGLILSDIEYIKACVERVERNLNKLDDGYKDIIERLAVLEGKVLERR